MSLAETIIGWALTALGIYLALGLLFGLVLAIGGGVRKLDPAAEKGSWGFRLIIIPGCAIFWPLLLPRWLKGAAPPEECTIHRHNAQP